ncbi:Flavorubredoxin [Syntrophus gentianae]|uniref:Flavorubredoxin n=1 Tax=Syntrophus gentianae TaxID=43775 RepID=A0A1H7WXV5_9BACT|nr:FprA family A-type flavoprotein [Syntrophus gentianae]SEM25699.1 Flavorubredoxin [Syntrophus gentianae]
MPVFKAIKMSDSVYWVGAIDWKIREFHGYSTLRGSTYNAYLILAEKVTLMDAVKAPFRDELLARIASVIDPQKIDYLVSNHSEMDHTGCLPEILAAVKPEKVFASVMGARTIPKHFALKQGITPVKSGDEISLGNKTLSFLETRMLHWPDSMFSYLKEDKILFSQDAFGMHLATEERYADEIPADILDYESKKYFANILLPYASQVSSLVDKFPSLGLEIKTIAPDHGPIWRSGFEALMGQYRSLAAQKPTRKALVVYDTMWHSTERMARAIEEGLREGGAQARLLPLSCTHRSEVAYEILEAGALIVGSPTLNNQLLPTLADTLTYLKGLRPRNLIGTAFGSYGWSGESPAQLQAFLEEMKIEIVGKPVKANYVPGKDVLDECFAMGMAVAERLQEVV